MVKFIRTNPQSKYDDNKKEEKQLTCFECGKFGHYKNDGLSLSKHKSKP